MDEKIYDILFGQLEQLRELSKNAIIEPEQLVEISLAMVEIAKFFNPY